MHGIVTTRSCARHLIGAELIHLRRMDGVFEEHTHLTVAMEAFTVIERLVQMYGELRASYVLRPHVVKTT